MFGHTSAGARVRQETGPFRANPSLNDPYLRLEIERGHMAYSTKPPVIALLGVLAMAAGLGANATRDPGAPQPTGGAGKGPAAPLSRQTAASGNTVSAFSNRWLQSLEGIAVAPDGTVLSAHSSDAASRAYGLFRDGDAVGLCADTHGWGEIGGSVMAISPRYMFIAMVQSSDGGRLTGEAYPPKDLAWFGISRRNLDGSHAPFAAGRGRFGDHRVIHEAPETMAAQVRGLACDARGRVYVSDPASARIRILDAETMQETGTIVCLRSRQLAVAPDGHLWALHAPDPGASVSDLLKPDRDEVQWRAVRYSEDGRELSTIWMPKGASPSSLAFDPRGRLYIADNAPALRVRVYADPNKGGRMVRTIRLPDPLLALTGLGCDGAGNLYVAGNKTGGGAILRCYEPPESGRRLRLRWELPDTSGRSD